MAGCEGAGVCAGGVVAYVLRTPTIPNGKGIEMRPSMPAIPDFTRRGWHDTVTNTQLTASILDGKGTLMPPFRDR